MRPGRAERRRRRSLENARPACVPPALVQAAVSVATGKTSAGLISVQVAALTQGVMKAVLFTKLKIAAAVLLTLAAMGVGVGALTYCLKAAEPARGAQTPPRPNDASAATPKDAGRPPQSRNRGGRSRARRFGRTENAPTPTLIVVDKDRTQCQKNGPLYKMDYVVNPKNKGVRWVVVWLVDADDYKKAPPIHPDLKEVKQKEVVLDQPCCQFEPHIVCSREGQTLTARNSGAIPHNTKIDSPGDNPNLNPLIPAGASVSIPDWKADWRPSLASCGIHPWMTAYVRVFDHPYFAVTDEDGRFKIDKAPVGKYRIVAWQESVGYLDKGLKRGDPIDVKADGVTEVNFPVKPTNSGRRLAQSGQGPGRPPQLSAPSADWLSPSRGAAAAAASPPARSSRSDATLRRRGRCRRGNTRGTADDRGNADRSAASRFRPKTGRRPSAVAQEQARQPAGQLVGDLVEGEELARPGRALDLEVVAVVVVELLQRFDDAGS